MKSFEIRKRLEKINPYANYTYDEKGLGDLFATIYKDECRYNINTKNWYIYDGKSWKEDKGNTIISRYAKEFSNELYIYSFTLENKQFAKEYSNFVKRLGSLRNRKNMIEDAKDKYPISSEMLDSNIYLFNCQNGTFNLRTFKLQPHCPNDLISKISNVIYNPDSKSTIFKAFINEVLENDTSKIEYLQKILGYSLTGDTSLEQLFILYGPSTRNGKSTFTETYANMLGNTNGYAITINPESLASRQILDGRQASGDIARLAGYRFVNANEVPQNMSLNSSLLKRLTGRDGISARQIYQVGFDFLPTFKLFFNTNYLPLIGDDTLFSSNRVNVITFNRHFTEDEQDTGLKNKLKSPDALSELFNWCIEGLKKFYVSGAIPPQAVINDTQEYRKSNDIIELFISEKLLHSKKNLSVSSLFDSYKNWLQYNGYPPENKTQFLSHLRAKNLVAPHGTVDGKTVKNVILGYEFKNKS